MDPTTRDTTGAEPYRSPYRRDYARLIHSPAFRRLQGKTQVFPGDESDFFRNRLTHSLEVAQIAKSIAIRLNNTEPFFKENNINIDLVELAGLAHDLGHPPFGHNGEAALDQCMKGIGGFEGNAQTFRMLTRTEKKDVASDFPSPLDAKGRDNRLGLNFAHRSLAAILKYDRIIPGFRKINAGLVKGVFESEKKIFNNVKKSVCPNFSKEKYFKTIECSIMDLADDIAYSTYDLEDTFKAGFLDPLSILSSPSGIFERVALKVSKSMDNEVDTKDVISVFLGLFEGLSENAENSSPLVMAANCALASSQLASNGYIRTKFTADLVSEFLAGVKCQIDAKRPMLSQVRLNPETHLKVEALKHFTFEATIMSPRLRISEQRGFDIIKALFEKLDSEKGHMLLPHDFRELYAGFYSDADKKRVIADFIAGMTDSYAVEFYGRIFSENPQTIFKPF
ncbi:MAG: dNTP triphosphohydrolase [Alphaproteobacteria bacterium]|nr:dNTP triphosphohydrolase [Alphaproteobacteria bacterium]